MQTAAVEARTAVARLAAARVQVEAAQAALRVERDRYELGAGTLYAVADAQSRLAQAESSAVQAAYGLVFRAALVRLAVGDVSAGRARRHARRALTQRGLARPLASPVPRWLVRPFRTSPPLS